MNNLFSFPDKSHSDLSILSVAGAANLCWFNFSFLGFKNRSGAQRKLYFLRIKIKLQIYFNIFIKV
jgi:hypothetical protein